MTMFELFLLYDRKHCKQDDILVMSFLLKLTFANAFISHFENIWLKNCHTQCKPVLYRRYVDGTFLLFRLTELGSTMEKSHLDISSLKSVFKSNGYSKNFID